MAYVSVGPVLFLLPPHGIPQAMDGGAYKIATVAGSGSKGDEGPATQAVLLQAEGLATDSSGNLYIADASANRVRRLDRGGGLRTIAGTGVRGFGGDGGPAAAAQLTSPYGLATDTLGRLYIA